MHRCSGGDQSAPSGVPCTVPMTRNPHPNLYARHLPVGAEPQAGGVHFRVWAPAALEATVELDGGGAHPLAAERGGYFAGLIEGIGTGARYRFRLDACDPPFPDPASRCQPDGPHGASEVVDPAAFGWSDAGWCGHPPERLVIYELHIGTFTPEGTWEAAARRLPALVELGVTAVEMMPVAEFPGRFGWGYDGVDLFAPTRLYGRPDDLRRFVDRAHGLGLAVILDVVYNHLGPDGNYLRSFAETYFASDATTEWGEALNFGGRDSGPVREFFVANAGYWIDEFHFDGLRLDATHRIFDTSDEHILAAIGRRVREAAGPRRSFVTAENEDQTARLARPLDRAGYGLDSLWNDDFHHSARVALTGRREGYYRPYRGDAREMVALARHGFLYQGQGGRGTPALDLPASRLVVCLENHDQVAHSAAGLRGHLLTSPGCWRAMTAFLLLSPAVPMLFQGQEFSTSKPFLYFADHPGELGRMVAEGRREFLAQFASLATPAMQARLDDPGDSETFRRCILDWAERDRHQEAVALHRDLLRLRRESGVFGHEKCRVDAAVLTDDAWAVRYLPESGEDWLLIVNLGRDAAPDLVAEPLLAPVDGHAWELRWSSEDPRYGGAGTPDPMTERGWSIPGRAAILLGSMAIVT